MQVINDQIVPAVSPYPRLVSCLLHQPRLVHFFFITSPLPRTLPVNRRTRHVESEIMCSGSRYFTSHPLRARHSKRSISRCSPRIVHLPLCFLASFPIRIASGVRRLESGYIAPGPPRPQSASWGSPRLLFPCVIVVFETNWSLQWLVSFETVVLSPVYYPLAPPVSNSWTPGTCPLSGC